MKVEKMIEKLLEFDLDKEIVIAEDSMRIDIRPSDIKEVNGKIIIQA